ncbi:MAG: NlpC/P60 family protein [Nocardioidaceae bacterium]
MVLVVVVAAAVLMVLAAAAAVLVAPAAVVVVAPHRPAVLPRRSHSPVHRSVSRTCGAPPDLSSWDCSGLTMQAWASAGVSLPHYSAAQYSATRPVSLSTIRPGDLLFWSRGSASSIYHVGIYAGGGMMIDAPRPGRTVEYVSIYSWTAPDLAGRP